MKHDLSPGVCHRLASLAYELVLIAAILLTASALYTPIKLWTHAPFWLDQVFRLCLIGILFVYFGTSWVAKGQTVAMQAWRLQLVTTNGQLLSWRVAGLRYLIALVLFVAIPLLAYLASSLHHAPTSLLVSVSLLWVLVPFLAIMFDPERQTLHDRLAGTQVVVAAKTVPPSRSSQKQ